MASSNLVQNLSPLLARPDIPDDARKIIGSVIGGPLQNDVWIYRLVVVVLGIAVLATIFGGIWLAFAGKADANLKLPDAIVAIGSAAVGALAGLLAPSPRE